MTLSVTSVPPPGISFGDIHLISLARQAGSTAALALTAAVAGLAAIHLTKLRQPGARGMTTLRERVGTVLAGVLLPGLNGNVVAAQQGKAGERWNATTLGHQAFWSTVAAMSAANLIGYRKGLKTFIMLGAGWRPTGKPANLWPTAELLAMAAQHGVTVGTANTDWPISPAAQTPTKALPDSQLAVCLTKEAGDIRGKPVRYTPAQTLQAAALCQRVAALNAYVGAGGVTGCLAPTFVRRFRHCLELGGRFYARGGKDNFQNVPKAERANIRIQGETTVEVDMSAAYLSIFLALTGTQRLPSGDLYALPGFDREDVKAWFVQTFGKGKFPVRWARADGPSNPRRHTVNAIKAAVLATYPAMTDLISVVPRYILRGLHEDDHAWALGQYLTYRESDITERALAYLQANGVVGLPMHDAIIVPKGARKLALEGLKGAFMSQLGVVPRIK